MQETPSNLTVIIMAAGKGTRMKSNKSKVLQKLAGRPLLGHVMRTAKELNAKKAIIIVGHEAEQVQDFAKSYLGSQLPLEFALQTPQLGTGHAVAQALPFLDNGATALILSGDVPLTSVDTLKGLLAAGQDALALLTVHQEDPTGYGRIVRDSSGAILRIVEQKDASEQEKDIKETYSGIMAVPSKYLAKWIPALSNNNAQGEYYLTDIVAMAKAQGVQLTSFKAQQPFEVAGVNSPIQLAQLERVHQMNVANRLLTEGVRLADPARFDLRDSPSGEVGSLVCDKDVEIDVGCIFSGKVVIGEGASIGAYCHISNAVIEAGASVLPYTHIEGDSAAITIGKNAKVGPFARLRPGTHLADGVHIGNFVEVKNSVIDVGSKANHLSYIGDADVGANVNFGAGSVVANYDGAYKQKSVIGDRVHTGSNSVLIAPIRVNEGATIAAGSAVSKFVPGPGLTISRADQVHVPDWTRPVKK